MTSDPTIPALIPPAARSEWFALARVLAMAGPAPCEYDPELWWSTSPDDVATAVAACRRCPALAECAAYVHAADERFGVWGALAAVERGQVRC